MQEGVCGGGRQEHRDEITVPPVPKTASHMSLASLGHAGAPRSSPPPQHPALLRLCPTSSRNQEGQGAPKAPAGGDPPTGDLPAGGDPPGYPSAQKRARSCSGGHYTEQRFGQNRLPRHSGVMALRSIISGAECTSLKQHHKRMLLSLPSTCIHSLARRLKRQLPLLAEQLSFPCTFLSADICLRLPLICIRGHL